MLFASRSDSVGETRTKMCNPILNLHSDLIRFECVRLICLRSGIDIRRFSLSLSKKKEKKIVANVFRFIHYSHHFLLVLFLRVEIFFFSFLKILHRDVRAKL